MRFFAIALVAVTALTPISATAQSLTPSRSGGSGDIVVTGTRPKGDGKPIPMSDWRVAETPHLLVFSRGDEQRLKSVAHNLEKLHFLLSVLLNRVDEPDETMKLSVTLFGDTADFDQLDLHNVRWQQGPYPKAFPSERHYDPREDGAILATTQIDQKIMLQQGRSLASVSSMTSDPDTPGLMKQSFGGSSGAVENVQVNESSFPLTAAGRLYSGFAQHYLLTYFPAAYPRWYLDGFGEIFATMVAGDGVVEYGRAPEGLREVTEWSGRYPLRDVLSGKYLTEKRSRTAWTPYQAWALTHLLFFSDEWKAPLHRYLGAVARGASPGEATEALGDVGKLQRELAVYRGRKVPFERMTYPNERAPAPVVRQLAKSEAGYVRGRLELGARLEIPPAAAPGADPESVAETAEAQRRAVARRADWLERLRENAERYPREFELQLLLAEAECRSGNAGACLAAADRALALDSGSAAALAWKGVAMAQAAVTGPAAERKARLRSARAMISRANRADTEAVLPLLAYYRSFAHAGETPTAVAVAGAAKALDAVPAAPASRLDAGTGLAARGEMEEARRTLRPIVYGPYEAPERPKAKIILDALGKK